MTTSEHIAIDFTIVSLAATFLLTLAFVVVYGQSRWWEHESGRNMMAFEVIIMLTTGMSLARVIFHEHPWFAWLRACVFFFVPIILAWRLWMLVRVQYGTPLDDDDDASRDYDEKHDRRD